MRTLEEYALNEALRVKWVIRKGKRKKKYVTTRKGKYRVEYDANGMPHEKRITATERRKRKFGQRRGKLKRKARIGLIELKRKKSFIARRNMGMQYNKKIPDVVLSRGPGGHVVQGPKNNDKTIHPKLKESLLQEAPHSYLFTDENGEDFVWDFYAEFVKDSSWLEQVIDIYTKRQLICIRPDKKSDEADLYGFDNDILDQITDNLAYNIEFLNMAADAFVDADKDLQDRFRDSVPAKLFTAMLPMIRILTVKKDKATINKVEV